MSKSNIQEIYYKTVLQYNKKIIPPNYVFLRLCYSKEVNEVKSDYENLHPKKITNPNYQKHAIIKMSEGKYLVVFSILTYAKLSLQEQDRI